MEEIPKAKSQIERIVGGTESEQVAAQRIHEEIVAKAQSASFINEREKTEFELRMLARAEKNVNNLRAKYGLVPIALPPEKLHTIDSDHITLGETTLRTSGGYEAMTQQTIVTEAEELGKEGIGRFDVIQHESLHAGQYQSLQIQSGDGKAFLDGYRTGVGVKSRRPNEQGEYLNYLLPLNEAITEENSRRFVLETKDDDPELGSVVAERHQQFEEFQKFCESHPNHGYPETLLQGDVLQSEINPENGRPRVKPFAYYHERQAMWKLFDKIHEKNPDAFPGKEQAEASEAMFDMVTQASLDGNILPFGRLMNNTFGRGTFRNYGHLQTAQEVVALIDSLDVVKNETETEPASTEAVDSGKQAAGEAKPEGATEAPKDAETEPAPEEKK